MLTHRSTATGSLTHRVKPERLAWPSKMGMTTGTINANSGLYVQRVYEYTSSMCVQGIIDPTGTETQQNFSPMSVIAIFF